MISTKTLAKLILSKEQMSNKKLQKLCYYVYAWHMALFNRPISDTVFEAWVHGPACYELYNEYKKYGWDEIPKCHEFLIVDIEVRNFVDKVFSIYSKYSADELEEMTHKETPWINARTNCGKYESSRNIIAKSDMINCYLQKEDILYQLLEQ